MPDVDVPHSLLTGPLATTELPDLQPASPSAQNEQSLAASSSVSSLCNFCLRCGSPCEAKTCQRCTVATYCNEQCQKEDWKPSHKRICQDLHSLASQLELVRGSAVAVPPSLVGSLQSIAARLHTTTEQASFTRWLHAQFSIELPPIVAAVSSAAEAQTAVPPETVSAAPVAAAAQGMQQAAPQVSNQDSEKAPVVPVVPSSTTDVAQTTGAQLEAGTTQLVAPAVPDTSPPSGLVPAPQGLPAGKNMDIVQLEIDEATFVAWKDRLATPEHMQHVSDRMAGQLCMALLDGLDDDKQRLLQCPSEAFEGPGVICQGLKMYVAHVDDIDLRIAGSAIQTEFWRLVAPLAVLLLRAVVPKVALCYCSTFLAGCKSGMQRAALARNDSFQAPVHLPGIFQRLYAPMRFVHYFPLMRRVIRTVLLAIKNLIMLPVRESVAAQIDKTNVADYLPWLLMVMPDPVSSLAELAQEQGVPPEVLHARLAVLASLGGMSRDKDGAWRTGDGVVTDILQPVLRSILNAVHDNGGVQKVSFIQILTPDIRKSAAFIMLATVLCLMIPDCVTDAQMWLAFSEALAKHADVPPDEQLADKVHLQKLELLLTPAIRDAFVDSLGLSLTERERRQMHERWFSLWAVFMDHMLAGTQPDPPAAQPVPSRPPGQRAADDR